MKRRRKHDKPVKLTKQLKKSKELEKENYELDNDLKATFPASDPITKY